MPLVVAAKVFRPVKQVAAHPSGVFIATLIILGPEGNIPVVLFVVVMHPTDAQLLGSTGLARTSGCAFPVAKTHNASGIMTITVADMRVVGGCFVSRKRGKREV